MDKAQRLQRLILQRRLVGINAAVTILLTYAAARWLIAYNLAFRDYAAIGGEVFGIALVALLAPMILYKLERSYFDAKD